MNLVRAGTRKSELARWQTERVLELLRRAHAGLQSEMMLMDTTGDLNQHDPLPSIGAKGLFTAELEEALRSGTIDIAVHSLKDLPTHDADGLVVGAILDRADVRDVLVTRRGLEADTGSEGLEAEGARAGLEALPPGAVVGTSSMRRAAQIRMLRPDVRVESIRGNVQTRLGKIDEGTFDAAVMAAAGLQRMGLESAVTEYFEPDIMLSAPGQGALAVQCRRDDERVLGLLAAIHEERVALATAAERAFLAALEGGCSSPVAALAVVDEDGETITLEGLVAAHSGKKSIRLVDQGRDADVLGRSLAQMALERGAAQMVLERGGAQLVRSEKEASGGGRLGGWRVVVTRAAHQAGPLCRALRAEGARVLAIPAIQITPIDPNPALRAAVGRLGAFDWVVCTSSNGVDMLFRALAEHDGADGPEGRPAWPPLVHAAAVGTQTAAAFRRHGVDDVVVPAEHTSEGLARALSGPGGASGARVLLVQASAARPVLAGTLRAAGAQLEVVAAYDTSQAPAAPEDRAALEAGVDAITFTSPSTARAFRSQFGELADRVARGAVVAAIGPVTARAAEELGYKVHVVADPHTSEGLVEGLAQFA